MEWAIVAATLVGPVAAVCISLWHQEQSAKKRARIDNFLVMMKLRRHPVSGDFVGALNLVPVLFYNCPKVISRFTDVIASVNESGWNDPQASQRVVERFQSSIAYLLSEMSAVVGFPIQQLDIVSMAYAPQRWNDDESEQRQARDAILALLSGKVTLPVTLIDTPEGP